MSNYSLDMFFFLGASIQYLWVLLFNIFLHLIFQGIIVKMAGAVVVGVGSNTAMGSIRDSMLKTEDVSVIYTL